MSEKITVICPRCKKPIEAEWDNGLVYDREKQALVADYLYHNECWDALVDECPPGKETDDA